MKIMKLSGAVGLSLLLLLGGCSAGNATTPAPSEPPATPVEVMALARTDIVRDIVYAGQVKPSAEQAVIPKMGGTVTDLYVEVGDRVEVDEVLFSIDEKDVRQSLDVLESQLATAQAAVSSAATGVSQAAGGAAQGQLLQLQVAVDNAQTAVKNAGIALTNAQRGRDDAQSSFDRTLELFGLGEVSQSDFERAESALTQARAGYDQAVLGEAQARTALSQAQKSYDLYVNRTMGEAVQRARDGLRQAEAAYESARIQLENAQTNADNIHTKSPIAGIVSENRVSVGGMVAAGTPALTIVDIDTVEIFVSVSEQVVTTLRKDDAVSIRVKAAREEPFTGVIALVSPAADASSTYLVKVQLDNKDGLFRPGMSAEVSFVKEQAEEALVLPRDAVLELDGTKFVMIAEDGMARRVDVVTGIDNGAEIQIVSGLEPGALVIVKGQQNAVGKISVVSAS